MEQETILKIGGIAIVVVMAFSMLAAAFLYAPDPSDADNSGINTNPIVNNFEYNISFESNVIKELNSFRMVASTSNLNKSEIDNVISKMDMVTKVGSEFRKVDDSTWNYFAEITLKKSANLADVLNEIFALDYFTGTEKTAMKYMTLASPGELILYNQELDINRNFTFEATVLPALVSIETVPGDTIIVGGTVTLRGMDITGLELIESKNISGATQSFSVEETLPIISLGSELLFEGVAEEIDQNYYQDRIKLIDENAQLYFVPDENNTRFAGQSSVIHSGELMSLFSEISTLAFYQDAEFELSSVFVNDLNKELPLNTNTLTAQVRLGHAVGDEVNLAINLSVQRDNAQVMQAIEN